MNNKRGRGYWKFNTSLLRYVDYVSFINKVIDEQIVKYENNLNKGLVWDTIKMEIRSCTISFASHKKWKNKKYEHNLRIEMDEIVERLAKNPDKNTIIPYITVIK
jgi:hypothetical protein